MAIARCRLLNIACSGIAPRGKKEDWLALAGNEERLQVGMSVLRPFQQAPDLGSSIEPRAEDTAISSLLVSLSYSHS